MSELCILNPQLLDHINSATSKAADPPLPAPDKVSVVHITKLLKLLLVSVTRLDPISENLNITTISFI